MFEVPGQNENRMPLTFIWSQGLVTIQVNILSMYKHIQGWTSFFTPARFKSCLFFKFLLIYPKPCLVQLPRPYSFQKISWPPPRLPLVKAQRSFLSGIRLSRELHELKVKVTAPPIKKTEVWNSRGFSFEARKIPFRFKLRILPLV